ncbi:MAG: hypothetical protein K8R23_03145 [Chthoniobacter sp.]|nr:hypothetical protein [Chthoniobacter sp.]
MLTAEAIQQWKLGYLKQHKDSPAREHRAINTVNAHIRNVRSLFTPKALAFAGKRLALPEPLPISGVKLETRRATTRYSSRIDSAALLRAAKIELGGVQERREQFKIFCLALLCGLRKREIDTLLWRSVDLEKGVLRIERTEYFQPKSEDSAAEIDVAPDLVNILCGFQTGNKGQFVIESVSPPRLSYQPDKLSCGARISGPLCVADRQRFVRPKKAPRVAQGMWGRDRQQHGNFCRIPCAPAFGHSHHLPVLRG